MAKSKIRNMEEFATVSGISRPTISKYFNDPESVRATTRERIEAALAQHEYRPNIYAINQNRRLTKNIGVVVPNLADPFFAEIARNIETMIIDTGFRPILMSSHGQPSQEIDNLESLRSIKPAGVLLGPLGRSSDHAAVEAFCEEIPTVLFDANIDGVGQAFFGSNNHQSIELIVDYLCRTGEPPAFFEMRHPTNPNAIKRRTAYTSAMEALGHPVELVQVEGDGWDFEEIGYRQGLQVISERRLPTNTVLCSNDRLAIGFLAAAYEAGLRVGRGSQNAMRVAGHDDHPYSRYTCPSLTTVSQDYRSISEQSVETLLALIEAGQIPWETHDQKRASPPSGSTHRETILFPGHLIIRDSA